MMQFVQLKLRGVIKDASTVTYVNRSAVRSGSQRLRRITILRDDFGDLLKLDTLLGRGRPPVSSAVSVEDFNQYFIYKVAAVRASTDGASEPSFKSCVEGQSLIPFF